MKHIKTEVISTTSEYGSDLVVDDIELDGVMHKLSIENKAGLTLSFDDGEFVISLVGDKLTFSRKRYSWGGDIRNPLEQTLTVSTSQKEPVWVPTIDSELSRASVADSSKPMLEKLSRPFMVPFGSVKEGSVKDENVSLKEAE